MSVLNLDLIKKYGHSGPRYTSYPTAVQFHESFDTGQYTQELEAVQPHAPLSLYFHLPFCKSPCYFCGCNKIITNKYERASSYLEYLFAEMELLLPYIPKTRTVSQLHWGGGTPTFFPLADMQRLCAQIAQTFTLDETEERDFSIEIDPREITLEKMVALRRAGFNRVSFGVQDFDAAVQQAINRVQPIDLTLQCFEWAKREGFGSINIDLIYGLPLQTIDSFRSTVERIIECRPDRLSIFHYAHIPSLFPAQQRFRNEDLPSSGDKLIMLQETIDSLLDAGYVYIGMDHFALPEDSLACAQEEGGLHRNFQGYTIYPDIDLVAMGVSAISKVGRVFVQNKKTLKGYYRALEERSLPLFRGVGMSDDDLVRGRVITDIICNFALDYRKHEKSSRINFPSYFEAELLDLQRFVDDGLIETTPEGFQVTAAGKYLVRSVCMLFDAYNKNSPAGASRAFSKVV